MDIVYIDTNRYEIQEKKFRNGISANFENWTAQCLQWSHNSSKEKCRVPKNRIYNLIIYLITSNAHG
jgi:hypothetical protein